MKQTVVQKKLIQLENRLSELGDVAVATSGGVDSMTLAVVANRVNNQSKIVHAVSPAVPSSATKRVVRYAEKEQWRLRIIDAEEMKDENYRRNPANRCYFCKTNLYSRLKSEIDTDGNSIRIVSGTNTDDLSDYRPGLIAATENDVIHPFVDAGIDKNTIREIAHYLNLDDLHELPAAPCLSSRVTTGIEIDPKLLPVIDQVETMIWDDFGQSLDLKTVRCRIQTNKIAIQLESLGFNEKDNGIQPEYIAAIKKAASAIIENAGYKNFHTVGIEPYRKGSAFIKNNIPTVSI